MKTNELHLPQNKVTSCFRKKRKKIGIFIRDKTALNSKLQSRTYVSPSDSAHCNLATNSYFIALHYKNHLYSLHTSWGQASHFLWCTGSLHSCMTKVRFIKRWDKEDGVFSFTFVGASVGSFALLIYFCISQISNEGEEAVQDWEVLAFWEEEGLGVTLEKGVLQLLGLKWKI